MREIKFRGWYIGYKGTRCKGSPVILYDKQPGDCLKWKQSGQDIEIMQYTGLKDKNGKEIYEGDIINIPKSTNAYEIVFEQGDFQTGFKKKAGNNLTDIGKEFCNKFEIIGNIYEK